MSPRVFDAWALPRSVSAEELALLAHDHAGLQVRRVAASPEWLAAVAAALRSSGELIARRSVVDLAGSLGSVGARFLDPTDDVRAEALELLPPTARLSTQMAEAVLDGMAADWTEARLLRLLREDLGDERVLDGFETVGEAQATGGTAVTAMGPRLCAQIIAGSVPGVSVTALVRSLLLKGPTLIKPGRGDVVLPVLFARALREADSELAEALAVVYWEGGQSALEAAALRDTDVVTAYGSDEAVSAVRSLTPITARFVAYHHRVSVGVVGRDALASQEACADAAADVAESVALFDQRGCVSPQTVFVEGDQDAATAFARAVADALAALEARLPGGPLGPEEASALHQLRGTVEMMAAAGDLAVIHGGAAAWTVVLVSPDVSLGACAGRIVRIHAVSDVADVPRLVEPLGHHLQTVGVAGLGDRLDPLAAALGRAGASRVVPFRSVAFPPPWWHHDGRGPLRDLVRWVDLERE